MRRRKLKEDIKVTNEVRAARGRNNIGSDGSDGSDGSVESKSSVAVAVV